MGLAGIYAAEAQVNIFPDRSARAGAFCDTLLAVSGHERTWEGQNNPPGENSLPHHHLILPHNTRTPSNATSER